MRLLAKSRFNERKKSVIAAFAKAEPDKDAIALIAGPTF